MLSVPVKTPVEKSIDAIIRIGQEIWCLPYAGFFLKNFGFFKLDMANCALPCSGKPILNSFVDKRPCLILT